MHFASTFTYSIHTRITCTCIILLISDRQFCSTSSTFNTATIRVLFKHNFCYVQSSYNILMKWLSIKIFKLSTMWFLMWIPWYNCIDQNWNIVKCFNVIIIIKMCALIRQRIKSLCMFKFTKVIYCWVDAIVVVILDIYNFWLLETFRRCSNILEGIQLGLVTAIIPK